ncbi:unnamed protein product [Closterium sp. NIES-54]
MPYIDMAIYFGTPKTILHKIVDAFLLHFPRQLIRTWVRFPTHDEMEDMAADFKAVRGLPNIIGAIDGTHIEIKGLENHRQEYYNRKSIYSTQLQVTCDSKGYIWDYIVGHPGSMHDQGVFQQSDLHTRLERGDIAPFQIVGDAAYPLRDYCLTPVNASRRRLMKSWEQTYNYVHSATRMLVERTFGALKQRWRLFSKRHECKLTRVCAGTACIIILHNMILHHDQPRRETEYLNNWREWTGIGPPWYHRRGMLAYSSLSTNAAFTKLPVSLAMTSGCAGAGTVAGRGGAGGGRHIAAAMCIAAMSNCTASLSCLMACSLHAFSVSEITLAAAMVAVSFMRERLAGTGLGVAGKGGGGRYTLVGSEGCMYLVAALTCPYCAKYTPLRLSP